MKVYKKDFLLSIVMMGMMCTPMEAFAMEAAAQEAIVWQGNVLSPYCFDELNPLENPPEPILKTAITMCQKNGANIDSNGWVNMDYPEGGYTSYKVISHDKNGYLVETEVSGGGSGRFSNVMKVNVDGDELKLVKRYSGGDRCNGGVHSSEFQDGKVYISYNITPADFYWVAYEKKGEEAGNQGLEGSAQSCFAFARYEEGEGLISVELNPNAIEDDSWGESRFPAQKCFNNLFANQIKKTTHLSKEEFKEFVGNVMSACKINVSKGKS